MTNSTVLNGRVVVIKKFGKVKRSFEYGVFQTIGDAARVIRAIASKSIKRRAGKAYSQPGQPPKTRFGQLRNAIQFDINNKRMEAVIGPVFSRMGLAASVHEKGGVFHGDVFPPRPFMAPALARVAHNMPKIWHYSVR